MINLNLENDACSILAKISRGTPRIALKLLKRIRDYAQVINKTNDISLDIVEKALYSQNIDKKGLDNLDRKFLSFLNANSVNPVGLDSIAASLGEDPSMLEFVVEPYLIQIGFIVRTSRGRLITNLGKKYVTAKNEKH